MKKDCKKKATWVEVWPGNSPRVRCTQHHNRLMKLCYEINVQLAYHSFFGEGKCEGPVAGEEAEP